jgi:phage shock protein PspC (stress-responsive transcriptional regulator)
MVSQAAIPQRINRARLRRRTENRLVAGVAGGIADRLNAPVTFVRLFIALAAAIWAPWTYVIYAGAALLLPAGDRDRPDWDNLVGAGRLGLVLAAPWLASPPLDVGEPLGGTAGWWIASYGLLAVGAAVMLSADYRRGRGRSREEARAAVLGALPVAGCVALLGAAILLFPDVRWERVAPLAAIAGGAVLLITGRREYVAPAMLALAAAVVIVASGARLDGGVGDVRVAPASPGGEPVVVRRAVGDVAIDLSRLPRSAGSVAVEASVGVGDLDITLPPGTPVDVDARVGRGSIDPWGLQRADKVQGFDQRLVAMDRISAGRPGRAPVMITADVGAGSIQIRQGSG